VTLKPGFGHHFVDQNAANNPRRPFEVVFKAVELMRPNFRFDGIDVLTDRNTLREFFDFCKGIVQDSFRLNLYLANDTLIIERCIRSPTKCLGHPGGSPFGHSFEKAVTWLPRGLNDSSSHHRVIQYDFGGLKCAVCCQVDVSYDDPKSVGKAAGQLPQVAAHDEKMESLVAAFSLMTLNETGTIHRGAGTDQASVGWLRIIKGRRSKPRPSWLPWLWWGRTRYLIMGHHDYGTFDRLQVHDMKEQLEAWEKNDINQQVLRKMVLLLSRLRDTLRTNETKTCLVIYEKAVKPPVLRIHKSISGKGPLPPSVVKKFWDTRET
jgi:hypothetical protein